MELATTNACNGVVFQPHGRRRHRNHYHSDSDTDSLYSASSHSSDSDDSTYYRASYPPRVVRWRRGPRGVIAYPGYSPWVSGGGGVIGGFVHGQGLINTAAVVPQLQIQTQAQQQQQQPRRYGYRRFHYQGGERVQRGCGHGHGHRSHHHHHRPAQPPRRCILPRFGRWLIGDPPERLLRRWGCDDGADCCDQGCGAERTTPTVHHEDEYWGPGVRCANGRFSLQVPCSFPLLSTASSPPAPLSRGVAYQAQADYKRDNPHHSAPAQSPAGPTAQTAPATPPGATGDQTVTPPTARTPSTRAGPSRRSRRAARRRSRQRKPYPYLPQPCCPSLPAPPQPPSTPTASSCNYSRRTRTTT